MNEYILKQFDELPENSLIINNGDLFLNSRMEYEKLKWYVQRMKKNNKKLWIILGNHDNYRMFAGDVTLDFPKSRNLDDITRECTIARGQLMLQAQPENSMWKIKQLKQMLPPPLGNRIFSGHLL